MMNMDFKSSQKPKEVFKNENHFNFIMLNFLHLTQGRQKNCFVLAEK